jgi:hypothetical protein
VARSQAAQREQQKAASARRYLLSLLQLMPQASQLGRPKHKLFRRQIGGCYSENSIFFSGLRPGHRSKNQF